MTRAIGTDGTPFDLMAESNPTAIIKLAMLTSYRIDPIALKAEALHDLTNCLIDGKGQLRTGTLLLNDDGTFRNQAWQDAAIKIRAYMLKALMETDPKDTPDTLPEESLIRLIAANMVASEVEGFATAIKAQDAQDKGTQLQGPAPVDPATQDWLTRHSDLIAAQSADRQEIADLAAQGRNPFTRPAPSWVAADRPRRISPDTVNASPSPGEGLPPR